MQFEDLSCRLAVIYRIYSEIIRILREEKGEVVGVRGKGLEEDCHSSIDLACM
jgi:hypothetical protein